MTDSHQEIDPPNQLSDHATRSMEDVDCLQAQINGALEDRP